MIYPICYAQYEVPLTKSQQQTKADDEKNHIKDTKECQPNPLTIYPPFFTKDYDSKILDFLCTVDRYQSLRTNRKKLKKEYRKEPDSAKKAKILSELKKTRQELKNLKMDIILDSEKFRKQEFTTSIRLGRFLPLKTKFKKMMEIDIDLYKKQSQGGTPIVLIVYDSLAEISPADDISYQEQGQLDNDGTKISRIKKIILASSYSETLSYLSDHQDIRLQYIDMTYTPTSLRNNYGGRNAFATVIIANGKIVLMSKGILDKDSIFSVLNEVKSGKFEFTTSEILNVRDSALKSVLFTIKIKGEKYYAARIRQGTRSECGLYDEEGVLKYRFSLFSIKETGQAKVYKFAKYEYGIAEEEIGEIKGRVRSKHGNIILSGIRFDSVRGNFPSSKGPLFPATYIGKPKSESPLFSAALVRVQDPNTGQNTNKALLFIKDMEPGIDSTSTKNEGKSVTIIIEEPNGTVYFKKQYSYTELAYPVALTLRKGQSKISITHEDSFLEEPVEYRELIRLLQTPITKEHILQKFPQLSGESEDLFGLLFIPDPNNKDATKEDGPYIFSSKVNPEYIKRMFRENPEELINFWREKINYRFLVEAFSDLNGEYFFFREGADKAIEKNFQEKDERRVRLLDLYNKQGQGNSSIIVFDQDGNKIFGL